MSDISLRKKAKYAKLSKKANKIILTVVAILVALIIIFPIIWIIPAAFKEKKDIFSIPNTFFPKPGRATFDNFIKVFTVDVNGSTFLKSMGVTFIVALLATFSSLLVNMFAGYALARINFKCKALIWILILFPMFIPGITIQLTSIKVVNALSLVDTIFVLFVPGMANSYQIFFFRQFYLNIPSNIEEAAIIDGANRFQIFFRIFVPMSITPMIIVGTGTFMGAWNSYIWPTLTVTNNPDLVQVMQVIMSLNSSYKGSYGVVIAATLLSLIVPCLVFAIFQKKIVEGIALTGTK